MIYSISDELNTKIKDITTNKINIDRGVHFTSKSTFYKIIQSGQFYFSDLSETNDIDEIDFGKNTLLTYFTLKYPIELEKIEKVFKLNERRKRQIFTLCLTNEKKSDNLQHWAMYSNNCEGVAITLIIKNLLNLIENNYNFQLTKYVLPVQYYSDNVSNVTDDELRVDNFIEKACAILYEIFDKINIHDQDKVENAKNTALAQTLFFLFGSMIKNHFWRSEEEIRVAIFPEVRSMIKYDTNCNKLVLPLKFVDKPIQNKVLNQKTMDNQFSMSKVNSEKIYRNQIIESIILGPKNNNYDLEKFSFFASEYDLNIPITRSIGNYSK